METKTEIGNTATTIQLPAEFGGLVPQFVVGLHVAEHVEISGHFVSLARFLDPAQNLQAHQAARVDVIKPPAEPTGEILVAPGQRDKDITVSDGSACHSFWGFLRRAAR